MQYHSKILRVCTGRGLAEQHDPRAWPLPIEQRIELGIVDGGDRLRTLGDQLDTSADGSLASSSGSSRRASVMRATMYGCEIV